MENQRPYSNLAENAQYGKLPPQAVDLEVAVLGALLLEQEAFHKISPIMRKEAFYKYEHQLIYDLIEEMHSNNKTIDIITVTQYAKDKGILDTIGGPLYITQLTSKIAVAAHIEHHSRIIFEKYIQREMIRRFSNLINLAYCDDIDELELNYTVETEAIDDMLTGNSGMAHIREILKRTVKTVEERQLKAQRNELPGMPTGLIDLDRSTNGWQPGELIIIAGRPGMGKTNFALHHAKAAAKSGKSVCFFSLEMTDISLSERLILSNGGIEQQHLKSGRMTEQDWTAYHRSAGELERLNLYIDDSSSVNVKYITSVARNKARRGECHMVVIDYLQLIDSIGNNNYMTREREVAEISRSLKTLAKKLDIPVILLAQLSRNVEHRQDKKPTLADLRESGAIEQDADIVIFPWRPEYYDPNGVDEEGNPIKNVVMLVKAKHREGDPGSVICKKSDDFTRIFDREVQMPEGVGDNIYDNSFYEKDDEVKF